MNQPTFFASANTTKGFFSQFHEVFDPDLLDEIYIIKGGPGTGKSSLMRKVADVSAANGLTVHRFLCSSDPNSLDGIIILEKKIAILDGTSPHATEPKFPGAVENIINTGSFWDKKALYQRKKEIISLIQEKNRYYRRAYQFLRASGEIFDEIDKIGERALLTEKMMSYVNRLEEKQFKKIADEDYKVETRILSTYNKTGKTLLRSFEEQSKTVYIIEDSLFCGSRLLELIEILAKKARFEYWKSYSCDFPDRIDAIYLPKRSCCFVLGERIYENECSDKEYHYINMNRFIDPSILRSCRQKIRFGKKCTEMLITGAIDAFSQAANAHSELENIYVSSMDFCGFNKMVDEFISQLHLS